MAMQVCMAPAGRCNIVKESKELAWPGNVLVILQQGLTEIEFCAGVTGTSEGVEARLSLNVQPSSADHTHPAKSFCSQKLAQTLSCYCCQSMCSGVSKQQQSLLHLEILKVVFRVQGNQVILSLESLDLIPDAQAARYRCPAATLELQSRVTEAGDIITVVIELLLQG